VKAGDEARDLRGRIALDDPDAWDIEMFAGWETALGILLLIATSNLR
jgi:hypothetical protein